MNKVLKNTALLTVLPILTVSSANALTIDFDYSYDTNNFFTAERRVVLESAAKYFESFKDQLTAIDTKGFNTWTASFINPSKPSELVSVNNLYIPENTVKIYVGAANLGGALGTAGPGGYSASGTSEFLNTVQQRGQGETQGVNAQDYSLWGGSLYLNNMINWNNSVENEPKFSQYDLFSVILHELGHVFGLGVSSVWNNQVVDGKFAGANAVAVNGGSVALNGDGDHWAQGTMSTVNGVAQEAALDPDTYNGQRKFLTDLDKAAFKDLGWEVDSTSEVPLPGALGLYLLGMAGIAVRKLKK